jgi:hypothetical protein
MLPHVRLAVAYIAGRLVSGIASCNVFDHLRPGSVGMSGQCSSAKVHVFDYENSCFIEGRLLGTGYQLFHHGERCHVQMNVNGNMFEGFDFGSSRAFNGKMEGRTVALFDKDFGEWFYYTI